MTDLRITHTHTRTWHSQKTVNKNTLANTDTGITQAFNKLFVQVKVDCRPLRKKEGWREGGAAGEATKGRAGECRGTGGTETLTETNKSYTDMIDEIYPSFSNITVWLLHCHSYLPLILKYPAE